MRHAIVSHTQCMAEIWVWFSIALGFQKDNSHLASATSFLYNFNLSFQRSYIRALLVAMFYINLMLHWRNKHEKVLCHKNCVYSIQSFALVIVSYSHHHHCHLQCEHLLKFVHLFQNHYARKQLSINYDSGCYPFQLNWL